MTKIFGSSLSLQLVTKLNHFLNSLLPVLYLSDYVALTDFWQLIDYKSLNPANMVVMSQLLDFMV